MGKFEKLDRLLERFANETVPGCACVIRKGDTILHESYAGFADREKGKQVDRESVFQQASTTKLITYAIMGMLYEEGAFLFSDPISEYLPEWKNTTKWIRKENGEIEIVPLEHPITIRDAAAMMCGLPYCMVPEPNAKDPTIRGMSEKMEQLLRNGIPTLREEVRQMAEVPVYFEPGSHWMYGFGSEIIGAVIEELTGKTLRTNFRERIIEPLGLQHTDTEQTAEIEKHLVTMYQKENGILQPMRKEETAELSKTPEGARVQLMTTAEDFSVFMSMLANGGSYKGEHFLSAGTIQMLTADQLTEPMRKEFESAYLAGYGYGLGFRVLRSRAAGFHNGNPGAFGWTGGTGIWTEADPKTGHAIVYMHNMMPNEELYHHHRVRNVVYGCLGNRQEEAENGIDRT